MHGTLRYFHGSIAVTVVGLALAAALGAHLHGAAGAAGTVFVAGMLAVLEVSLSFDNAVVNATVLQRDDARLAAPLPHLGHRDRGLRHAGRLPARRGERRSPASARFEALRLAALEPRRVRADPDAAPTSASALSAARSSAMVGLKYFFDAEKDVHWIAVVERAR